MKVVSLDLPEVLRFEPRVFGDSRGYFFESWVAERYAAAGVPAVFVQDNVSRSRSGVLRGIHLQHPHAQGKLVTVLEGAVFDIAVDVRFGSPRFGQWCGAHLSADNHHQLWVPPGFAHGFLVLSDYATFAYKCTAPYHPEAELVLRWDDPTIGVAWPEPPSELSVRDASGLLLDDVPRHRLPVYDRDA